MVEEARIIGKYHDDTTTAVTEIATGIAGIFCFGGVAKAATSAAFGGEKNAHIVVAHALKLNGAMIANAEVDEEGKFTDHGHLTLKVGELFVQHIYDYDNGHTLGLSVSVADKMREFVARPEFGMHDKEGTSYASVGKGDIICIGDTCQTDQANRDVSQPQTFETNYNIETIKAYITNFDADEALRKIPRDANGNIDFGAIVGGYAQDIYNQFKDIFGENKPDQLIDKDTKTRTDGDADSDLADEKEKKRQEFEELDQEIMKLASGVIGDSEAKRLAVLKLVYDLKKIGYSTEDAVGLSLEAIVKAEQVIGEKLFAWLLFTQLY